MKQINITRLVTLLTIKKEEGLNGNQIRLKFADVGGVSGGTLHPELERLTEEKFISKRQDNTYRIMVKGEKEILNISTNLGIVVHHIKKLGGKVSQVEKKDTAKPIKKNTKVAKAIKKEVKAKAKVVTTKE